MGVEATFQAMPENCELFIAARQDRDIAEDIVYFHFYTGEITKHWPDSPKWVEFYNKARQVVAETPGIRDRYFYAGARKFDAVIYLLSPTRRTTPPEKVIYRAYYGRELLYPEAKDTSLIYQAYYGQELLHPEAKGGQGGSIGVVTATGVALIAEYLNQMSHDALHEHYDPHRMYYESGVYKIQPKDESGGQWEDIWDEFEGIRHVYQAAAEHGEAVIVHID